MHTIEEDHKNWFSNLFKSFSISMNVSSKGPITLSTSPTNSFDRTVVENLGLRALLSAGIGDHNYQDRIFSARITLPKVETRAYEALIFNFIVREDTEHITLKMNSKALTLLIFVFDKQHRKYVNLFEEELELLLAQSNLLPTKASDLLSEMKLMKFINTVRKTIISAENEILLNYSDFTIHNLYDEDKMRIETTTYLDDLH